MAGQTKVKSLPISNPNGKLVVTLRYLMVHFCFTTNELYVASLAGHFSRVCWPLPQRWQDLVSTRGLVELGFLAFHCLRNHFRCRSSWSKLDSSFTVPLSSCCCSPTASCWRTIFLALSRVSAAFNCNRFESALSRIPHY